MKESQILRRDPMCSGGYTEKRGIFLVAAATALIII